MLKDNSNSYTNYFINSQRQENEVQDNENNSFNFVGIQNVNTDKVISQYMIIISDFLLKNVLKNQKREDLIIAMFQDILESLNLMMKSYFGNDQIQDAQQNVNLSKMVPFAINLKILLEIFQNKYFIKFLKEDVQNENAKNVIVQKVLDIQKISQNLTNLYTQQSKFYLKNNGVNWKRQRSGNKEIKRTDGLFSQIFEILIQFNCQYFTTFFTSINKNIMISQCETLFQTLFITQEDQNQKSSENFTLLESLTIMNQLNDILIIVPSIIHSKEYWSYIQRGTYDYDSNARKVALVLLQKNVFTFQNNSYFESEITMIQKLFQIDKKQFDVLWQTFFDVYDTLDSFSSHLTKAIWERTEIFYQFLNSNSKVWKEQKTNIPIISNFQEWLNCLSIRALTHENVNIRKYVQKEILQRSYMSPLSNTFIFDKFLENINEGLILKDCNHFTLFSKNNKLIADFYINFFKNESSDVQNDLRQYFNGIIKHINHSQMIVAVFKVFSQNYQSQKGISNEFIGHQEMKLLSEYNKRFKIDLIFSNRYICFKYILQMITYYSKKDELDNHQFQANMLVLLGQMPFEFFSASDSIIYTDREGLESSVQLIQKFGKENIQNMIQNYLNDIFQVKAQLQAIPKFQCQNQIQSLLSGLVKLLLILDTKFEEENAAWFQQIMEQNLEIFYGQVLTSSYLSPEIIEQKIECFTLIYNDLLKFSSTQKHRDLLIYQVKLGAHLILDRLENSLLVILSMFGQIEQEKIKNILGFQEKSKLSSAFKNLTIYCNFMQMVIRVFHIYQSFNKFGNNQVGSDSVLEKIVKLILNHALKITQLQTDQQSSKVTNIFNQSAKNNTTNLGVFLWQHVVFELLNSSLKSYSEGIKDNIKRKINILLVPDSIFTLGKSICMNLVHLQPIQYHHWAQDSEKMSLSEDQYYFLEKLLIDNEISTQQIQSLAQFNFWATMGEFLKVFQYDDQLKNEMLLIMYPQISENSRIQLIENMEGGQNLKHARAKGSNWTQEEGMFNHVVFSIVKITYLPLFAQKMLSQDVDLRQKKEAIIEYQEICRKAWDILRSLKGVFQQEALQEFLELTFSQEILEIFMQLQDMNQIDNQIVDFHRELAKEIIDQGNQFWLILRSVFNHLMYIFASKPYLISLGFDTFIVDFTTCREIRSLDSDIHLYRLETLIPEVIPKKYEDLPLEEISYQGAYIRSVVLIIIEGTISNVLTQINCISLQDTKQSLIIQKILNGLEQCIIQLFKANSKLEQTSISEMPYSQQHRKKLRVWQSLIVFLQLLDPQIYSADFRKFRKSFSGFDIVEEINKFLWHSIKQSHISSIRQYIEIFTTKFCLLFAQDTIGTKQFLDTLLDPNVKAQVSSSFIMIAGYCMVHIQENEDSQTTHFKKQIFDSLIGFCASNSAHQRCMAQYFIREMFRDPIFRPFIPQGNELLFNYFEKCKNSRQILEKYKKEVEKFQFLTESQGMKVILSTQIDSFGEFMHEPVLDSLKALTSEVITALRNDQHFDGERQDYWQLELNKRQQSENFNLQMASVVKSSNIEIQSESILLNYQKKMLIWDQIELEKSIIRKQVESKKRNNVIICASLIDKVPNLAGLTRTCEIMNAKALVLDNKDVINTEEFRQIAVTAQKWLPIYEIKVNLLLNYLTYQKQNGYKILGLEQTANSKMLNEYPFPEQCIILLGKEKEGIPQEYLGILDDCIEIPQFGIIRSLNVHVSGALCLWEYTKQMVVQKQI